MPRNGAPRDLGEFRSVFESHRDEVYRFLYRLTGHAQDAEDLLQETFARLWRKRDQFRGEGSLAGYLRRIAYRLYLNARPRLQRNRAALPLAAPEPAGGAPDPARRASREDLDRFLLARVREEVKELPDSWRVPFVLFRYEGWTMKQIAELLDVTPKAVEVRLARALRRVADRLRDLRERYGTPDARKQAKG